MRRYLIHSTIVFAIMLSASIALWITSDNPPTRAGLPWLIGIIVVTSFGAPAYLAIRRHKADKARRKAELKDTFQ